MNSLLIGLALVACLIFAVFQRPDTVFEFLADVGIEEDATTYAGGFSENAFARVEVGMSMADVERLLGPPLEKYVVAHSGQTGWKYTWKHCDCSYRVRVLLFRDGRVEERIRRFYVD